MFGLISGPDLSPVNVAKPQKTCKKSKKNKTFPCANLGKISPWKISMKDTLEQVRSWRRQRK